MIADRTRKSITLIAGIAILSVGLLFLVERAMLRRALNKVDFAGLGEQLTDPLIRNTAVNLSDIPGKLPDSGIAETYVRAHRIGEAARRISPIPETSSQLVAIDPSERLDAWGRPFCISQSRQYVVVMSFGSGPAESDCSILFKKFSAARDIKPGLLYFSSGSLFVAVPSR
jgi:hypothetical protein